MDVIGQAEAAAQLGDLLTPAVAAFVFGLATGWLVWGGRGERVKALEDALQQARAGQVGMSGVGDGARNGDAADISQAAIRAVEDTVGPGSDSKAANSKVAKKIGALEEELKSAKTLFDESASDLSAFTDLLNGLDAAIKSANGRLKMLTKVVRRGKSEG